MNFAPVSVAKGKQQFHQENWYFYYKKTFDTESLASTVGDSVLYFTLTNLIYYKSNLSGVFQNIIVHYILWSL